MESKKIVAISSCAAGIAHTYMAKEKLVEAATELGHEIKVETRGAITENVLSQEDINNADMVIIAADVDIDLLQFVSKKVWVVDTNAAIKDAKQVIADAFKLAKVHYGKGAKAGNIRLGSEKKTKYSKYIMTAIGFMVPITIAGGLLMAVPNALAITPDGGWSFPNDFTEALWKFGQIGLRLMGPILAMFLANAIGGKSAMAAGLLGGFFITDSSLMSTFSPVPLPPGISPDAANAGFMGALLIGFAAGYVAEGLKWINWPKALKSVIGLMIIPLLSSFIVFIIVVYVVGGPITWLVSQLYVFLNGLSGSAPWANILIGMLFAALICVDLGGPINKTTMVVAGAIFADTMLQGDANFIPNTACQSAISIPPLAMWIATTMFPHKFSTQLKAAGKASLPMGLVGISEGALPFAFNSPLKTISSCMVGALFAGGISALADFNFYGGLGSPLGAWIGIIGNSGFGFYWFLTVIGGALIAGIMFGLITTVNPKEVIEHKLAKVRARELYAEKGLVTPVAIFKYNVCKEAKIFAANFKESAHPKNWIKQPV
ncbi:MAG: PTS fructose transporter subunit IIC [Mycoplasma sp.]